MKHPAVKETNPSDPLGFEEVFADLPLLHPTPRSWAELAAARLPEFLADHAVCEQQVAVYALSLAGYYPEDAELVERAAALAAEEVQHFRRVVAILRKRGWPLGARRKNVWAAQGLRARIVLGREPWTKVDRLLFGAMIEARSCERFTRLLEVVDDPEVVHLLADLGPAERRYWQLFYRLASRDTDAEALAARFQGWREFEATSPGASASPRRFTAEDTPGEPRNSPQNVEHLPRRHHPAVCRPVDRRFETQDGDDLSSGCHGQPPRLGLELREKAPGIARRRPFHFSDQDAFLPAVSEVPGVGASRGWSPCRIWGQGPCDRNVTCRPTFAWGGCYLSARTREAGLDQNIPAVAGIVPVGRARILAAWMPGLSSSVGTER